MPDSPPPRSEHSRLPPPTEDRPALAPLRTYRYPYKIDWRELLP